MHPLFVALPITRELSLRAFKHAERVNAKRLFLVGDAEWERGAVRVKDLATREESDMLISDLL